VKIVECKSKEGITVGLIDAVNTLAWLIADRDLEDPEVEEALKDLRSQSRFKILCGVPEGITDTPEEITTLLEEYRKIGIRNCVVCGAEKP
jgi:hypothetical protein